jgi:polyphosphate kinase
MKEQGARVIYGVQGLKVHSKLLKITRVVKGKEQIIAFIGTGNFHEKTAKIYSDVGYFTGNVAICQEVRKVFRVMENNIERGVYRNLLVSPFNNRRKLTSLIQAEIENAKKGFPSGICIKINNLVDIKMIDKLYQASNAGVKIKLNVRGVCCLVPGIKNQSENIEAISVVDRFLEHARFMIFENNGNPLYYISSFDWMERNLDKRIEVGAPIYDRVLQNELQTIFGLQWSDNQKSRVIDKKLKNKHNTDSFLYIQIIVDFEYLVNHILNSSCPKNQSDPPIFFLVHSAPDVISLPNPATVPQADNMATVSAHAITNFIVQPPLPLVEPC